MARCKDCIHYDVCKYRPLAIGVDICDVFRSTADVAPKSDVDLYRKQVDELEDELASTYDKLEKAKAEVAREIFAEIEKIIEKSKHQQATPFGTEERYNPYVIVKQVSELKKKYAEKLK